MASWYTPVGSVNTTCSLEFVYTPITVPAPDVQPHVAMSRSMGTSELTEPITKYPKPPIIVPEGKVTEKSPSVSTKHDKSTASGQVL